jgi:hypothetical protein
MYLSAVFVLTIKKIEYMHKGMTISLCIFFTDLKKKSTQNARAHNVPSRILHVTEYVQYISVPQKQTYNTSQSASSNRWDILNGYRHTTLKFCV